MKFKLKLFQFYGSASFFEFSFQSVSVSFGDFFFNSFRSAVNDFFCFFQAKASCFTNNFDNVDFASASGSQNYVEFSFFFSSSSATSARRATRAAISRRCPT